MTIRVLFGLGLFAVLELLSLLVPAQLLPLEQAARDITIAAASRMLNTFFIEITLLFVLFLFCIYVLISYSQKDTGEM